MVSAMVRSSVGGVYRDCAEWAYPSDEGHPEMPWVVKQAQGDEERSSGSATQAEVLMNYGGVTVRRASAEALSGGRQMAQSGARAVQVHLA
jgi:hypothetical protein